MPDKAKMLGTACVLLVRDFEKGVAYWKNCLGFTAHIWGEPPNFAIMERDNIRVMLSHAPDHNNKPNWEVGGGIWNGYFWGGRWAINLSRVYSQRRQDRLHAA
ncbi:hypothetical protein [Ahrensia sp. 13_GOM-1096m]|uniref:hypothetical protein n=1 Tax=Ahrensia sp. 13_GOM-1096m TaxID=1380380 RepID=UPI000B2F9BD2|nr:hypothetical protein [Ahrensia sp. 13_GOM-1096m]